MQSVDDLEKKIKPQINSNQKKGKCSHQNISWNAFFKSEKIEDARCLDCGDEESNKFSGALQRWYHKQIENWLKAKGLKTYEFDSFLKKEGYFDVWNDVQRGKYEDAINSFMGQVIMKDIAKCIEEHCLTFAKSKGVDDFAETSNNNSNNNPTERESRKDKVLVWKTRESKNHNFKLKSLT
ncbi:MAG: hypothetical protein GBAus27B_000294 [Mycoplasmataceae bacterium]|nr:MAG: hypothetical protein GBAus27B_000294 [Mycoplasmataceae bacterium]